MTLKTHFFSLLIFLSSSVFSFSQADQNLLSSCQNFSADKTQTSLACHYFIQGFLSSAHAIDSSLKEKQSKKKYQHYRTKGRILPAKFIYFCIPENKPEVDIIVQIGKKIPDNIKDLTMLRDNIFNLLQTQYPCSKMSLS